MFSFPEAAKILDARLFLPAHPAGFSGASLDSRKIQKGELFAAFKGAQSDGHLFLEEVFAKGATGALVEESYAKAHPEVLTHSKHKNLLVVPNTEKALQKLAGAIRDQVNPVCLAITGSVGKTSTKEFLTYLLSRKFPLLATQGNFNNHLGLPLTLLRLSPEHKFCVAELGANHIGEISFLGKILKQQHAILTKVAPAHLEGFGSLDGVYKAKLEIMEPLQKSGVMVLPDNDPRLIEAANAKGVRVLRVGNGEDAEFRLNEVESAGGRTSFKINGKKYGFPGSAGFLAQNAAMAFALATSVGLNEKDIPEFWEGLSLPSGRFEEKELDGIRIIFDGYNANPASFQAAVETFGAMKVNGRKWIVCSDMGELGEREREFHEALGTSFGSTDVYGVLGYGSRTQWTLDAARKASPRLQVHHFEDARQAGLFLKEKIRREDAVLLKASRSMKMEDVLKVLEAEKLQTAK